MSGPVPDSLFGHLPRLWYVLIEIREQDPDSLPLDNVLATIATFEQAPTAEALEEPAGSLDERLEAIGEPALDEHFQTWIELVLTQRHGPQGEQLRRTLRKAKEEKGTMTLIERARKWGEERDRGPAPAIRPVTV